MQDELANMFNQRMTFAQPQAQEEATAARPPPTPTANFSISQHYHHSAHQVPLAQEAEERRVDRELTIFDTAEVLSKHGVDPSNLSASQITLFKLASPDQRHRLIELWKISPPQASASQGETSLEKEENMARSRYESMVAAANSGQMDMAEAKQDDAKAAEPYIKSGYEILAEREYNDQAQASLMGRSIYQPLGSAVGTPHRLNPSFSSKEWWRDFVGQQPMEYQYGMFEQMSHFQQPQPTTEREDEEML